MKRLGPVDLKKSKRRPKYGSNKVQIGLSPPERLMRIEVSDRYRYFLRSFPDGTRVPCALMKIGIIADEIKAKTHSLRVERDQNKIKETPTTDLSARMLSEFRRYMSHLHRNNDLPDTDKKCIGNIITISNLGAYPKTAGDFRPAVSDKKQYQGIRVESYTDKYDLDEVEAISQETPNKRGIESPPPEKEIREHRKAVQDDVELDKV